MNSAPARTAALEGATAGRATRRYDLDWLRAMAVLLLIPFHAARIFDVWEPFYVKDAQSSVVLSYLIALMWPWHMPLLFFIAGSATWFALGRRDPARYLAERSRRLLVPFLFGTLVIVPPQAYLARMREPGYAASYLDFLGGYFRDFRDLTGYFGSFTPGHLWFILFLFVISCSALPLVGLAHAHLDVAHPALRYANEAAYPFYILHQTVLVAVGWWVVRWPVGVALKWALICVVGGGLTLAAYEVLVRRSRLMRFLFGMKPAAP